MQRKSEDKFWLLIESTFPCSVWNKSKIFLANHDEGRGQLCPDDISYLSCWIFKVSDLLSNNISNENLQEKFLHPEGELEHLLLAERFQTKFPDLFPKFYAPADFKFRATNTERSIKSQFFFATGMFDRKGDNFMFSTYLRWLATKVMIWHLRREKTKTIIGYSS